MKIIVAPASFKGTLSSKEAGQIISGVLKENLPKEEITTLVMADGGEGTMEAIIANGSGIYHKIRVRDALSRFTIAKYLMINDQAIIEVAEAVGLSKAYPLNPLKATSFGVGEMINSAILNGAKNIYLTLGGSATTEFGCGLISALGGHFYNKNNDEFIPTGGTLKDIQSFDLSEVKAKTKGINFVGLVDVSNPLMGKDGAAYVFGPQKGANDGEVALLDEGLKHLNTLIIKEEGIDVNSIKGSGAAGGIGGGIVAFLNATLTSGIDYLLDLLNFEEIAKDCDYLITGEGSLDSQSLMGKVIYGLLKRKSPLTKVIVICGRSSLSEKEKELSGIKLIKTLNNGGKTREELKKDAKTDLLKATLEILPCLKTS